MNLWTSIKQVFLPVRLETRKVRIADISITIADASAVQEEWFRRTGSYKKVKGFCNTDMREIWVGYDDNLKDKKGNRLPNLDALGHELCHFPELYGEFHR